jgi:T5SS/PEP-CTERM-associated repeat protein/autotransporter-associated beta strand protein
VVVENGGELSNTNAGILANTVFSTANVTVTGANSTWTNASHLIVGNFGSATLTIQNGGAVANTFSSIGESVDGVGTVTVDGPGSTWTNTSSLSVGLSGTAVMNIINGGRVTNVGSSIGSSPGSDGTVTVSGPGSTWINSAGLDVGFAGTGTLNIVGGGLVSAATLSGGSAGSSVNFDGGTLRISETGSASNVLALNPGGGKIEVPTSANTFTVTSNISGAGGLTKLGTGTLALTGANAYTGDTRINAGTLSISQAYLHNLADVYLTAGVSFALNFPGIDQIDSLFIGGAAQAVGTYGAIGSGADFPMAIFTGTGLLRVTTVGLPGDYNNDGRVDAADYVVWRKVDGTPQGFNVWRANFGEVLDSGSGGTGGTVPEPSPIALLTILFAARRVHRRRLRFRTASAW